MSPEVIAWARVGQLPAVAAIVASRVYLEKLPQKPVMPCVLVQLVHEPTQYHLRGGLRDRARVQVDAYVAETPGNDAYLTLTTLADAIHGDDAGSGLSGWRGEMGSPPTRITGILRIERDRAYEPSELRLLRMRQDYWVFFRM